MAMPHAGVNQMHRESDRLLRPADSADPPDAGHDDGGNRRNAGPQRRADD
jgi:hypothetical protein